MGRPIWYELDANGNPVALPDCQYPKAHWQRKTRVGLVEVSTVFLGLDHRYCGDDGPPILFETMIFGDGRDDYQERYVTLAEAEAGHRRAFWAALSPLRQLRALIKR